MKPKEVYDEGGERLGDEYVDLSGLQTDTKTAIFQLLYLDKTADIMNDAINKATAPDFRVSIGDMR